MSFFYNNFVKISFDFFLYPDAENGSVRGGRGGGGGGVTLIPVLSSTVLWQAILLESQHERVL